METCGLYGHFTTQGSRIANKTIRGRKQWTAYHLTTNQKVGSSTLSGRTIFFQTLIGSLCEPCEPYAWEMDSGVGWFRAVWAGGGRGGVARAAPSGCAPGGRHGGGDRRGAPRNHVAGEDPSAARHGGRRVGAGLHRGVPGGAGTGCVPRAGTGANRRPGAGIGARSGAGGAGWGAGTSELDGSRGDRRPAGTFAGGSRCRADRKSTRL